MEGYRYLVGTMLVKDEPDAILAGLARLREVTHERYPEQPFVMHDWEHKLFEAMLVERGVYSEEVAPACALAAAEAVIKTEQRMQEYEERWVLEHHDEMNAVPVEAGGAGQVAVRRRL